jgi:hypothetical protein
MGIQQENIIATVKYRYGKSGACYKKRHKPSLSWKYQTEVAQQFIVIGRD